MKYIIVLLLIIISFLVYYLFALKKDLKRITKFLKITNHKNTNTLIHKELEVKELTELINEINEILKENKEIITECSIQNTKFRKMITNISHDLRTPLTSALGYIDIILNSNIKDKEKQNELKIIEERLKRLEELINSFFDYSKVISNQTSFKLTEINIINILEESIGRFYDDYQKENRKIVFINKIKKYNIISNKEMLARIFDNLINNALKHSKSNLQITLELKEKLTIIFKNELDNKNLDINHIFDEFYIFDISRTKGNTGLGLAIAKEFVELLNGSIKAQKTKNNLEIIIDI